MDFQKHHFKNLLVITSLLSIFSACTMNFSPVNSDGYFNKRFYECESLISANKPSESLSCSTRLIVDFPESSLAYNQRSGIYYMKGEYTLALKDIEKAIDLDSRNSEFYRNRGIIYFRIPGKHNLVLDEFNKAIDLNSDDSSSYEWRSSIYQAMGNYDLALEDINESIRLNPKNPNAYSNRASIYYSLKQQDDALADCYQAVALNPKSAASYDLIGIISFHKGEIDKAILNFNKSIEIDSGAPNSYANRASAYWVKGRRKEAIADLKKAVQIEPKFPIAYLKLGYVMDQEKNRSNAKSYFERAVELDPQIVSFPKRAEEFTDVPQIRAFYADMSLVASKYLKNITPSPDSNVPMLNIDKITTDPVKVKSGVKFDIIVDYTVTDKTTGSQMITVKFDFTIAKKGQIIFSSEKIELESQNGATNRRIQHMNPTDKKGQYDINVTFQYGEIIKNKTHKITIK